MLVFVWNLVHAVDLVDLVVFALVVFPYYCLLADVEMVQVFVAVVQLKFELSCAAVDCWLWRFC